MKKSKEKKHKKVKTPIQTNRLDFINDESCKPVIPIGLRFQAAIPCWIGPPRNDYYRDFMSTKWLGIRVWPHKDSGSETNVETIGKGRTSNYCSCPFPGSIECVKCHISERRSKLESDLGAAFWGWKFDEIGEEVSKFWKLRDQQRFDCVVKKSFPSEGYNFVKLASELFPTQTTETIVRYYFNVYVPRRMKIQTRSGCEVAASDDDEDGGLPCVQGSRKRCRAYGPTQTSGKKKKKNYLSRTR